MFTQKTVVSWIRSIVLAVMVSVPMMASAEPVAKGDVTFTAISDAHICGPSVLGVSELGEKCAWLSQISRRKARLRHALGLHEHGMHGTERHAKGEFVIALGDNIEDYSEFAVERYYRTMLPPILAPTMDLYTILGNHDTRQFSVFNAMLGAKVAFTAAALLRPNTHFVASVGKWDRDGWYFFALNSGENQVDPRTDGSHVLLSDDQLVWLQTELDRLPENSKSAILFLHHAIDKDIAAHLQGNHDDHECAYIDILQNNEDKIKAVFTGHRHNFYHYSWDLNPDKEGRIETYTVGSTGAPGSQRYFGGLDTPHAYGDLWLNVKLGSDGSLEIINDLPSPRGPQWAENLVIGEMAFRRLDADDKGNASIDEGTLVYVDGVFGDVVCEPGICAAKDYSGTAIWSDGVESTLFINDRDFYFETSRIAPAGPAVLTVDITIMSDPDTPVPATSPQLTVNNVPPLLNYIRLSQGSGDVHQVTLNGGWYDRNDLCTVIVDWGDGTTEATDQPESFTISHDYADLGTYDVTVWVSDGEFTSPGITDRLLVQDCDYDETKLTASDAVAEGYFGQSVAVDGDWAAVGAPRADDDPVSDIGAVYMYQRNGDAWVPTEKLMANDAAAEEHFGHAVSVSSNRVVVGAPLDDDRGDEVGSAYVFEWDGSHWLQTAKLLVEDVSSNYDRFGSSVSVDDDTIVIGAPADSHDGDEIGAAYVYHLNGAVWEETKLTASNLAPGDRFGKSVSVSGNRVVVGAPGQNWFAPGAVYVYELADNAWQETNKITDRNWGDTFGYSVSIDGDRFVVGTEAMGDDAPQAAVALYVYEWNGSDGWTETILKPGDSSDNDYPGGPVSIRGDRIVGATPVLDGGYGSFYVYEWKNNGWFITRPITAVDTIRWDQVGMSAAVSGDTFVIGSPHSDAVAENSGAVYIFDSLNCTWSVLEFPEAKCQDFMLEVDVNGSAVLNPGDIDAGSSHPDDVPITLTIDKTEFDCADSGPHTMKLTVTDSISGTQAVCDATVLVADNEAPTAFAQGMVVQLDENGTAFITVEEVNNGSFDNCGVSTVLIDENEFDCSNVGDNTVTLTVVDLFGNESAATAVVTVEDNIPPVAAAQDIEVWLDETGSSSIAAAEVDNASSDVCGIASMSVSPASLECGDVGDNTATLTVTDPSGNVSTATAIVSVQDNLAPVNVQSNDSETIIIPLDVPVSFTATVEDNCAGSSIEIPSFDCYKISNGGGVRSKLKSCDVEINGDTITINKVGGHGDHITWDILATDYSGNSSTGAGAVEAVSTTPPVAATSGSGGGSVSGLSLLLLLLLRMWRSHWYRSELIGN